MRINQVWLLVMARFFFLKMLAASSWEFVAVTDLDHSSKIRNGKWGAYAQRGVLRFDSSAEQFSVLWGEKVLFKTSSSSKGRSMELSEISYYNNNLLAFCDRSGFVFDLDLNTKLAFIRAHIRSGDGNQQKAFKTEWATEKGGKLILGSTGKEWTEDDGTVQNEYLKWVKTMDTHGFITNQNWKPRFEALRAFANASYPGYIIHEAVVWEPRTRSWLFLPRKISHRTPYAEATDETMGANTLLIASEDMNSIRSVTVGPFESEWGFSAFKVIPERFPNQFPSASANTGSASASSASSRILLLGIKVREVKGQTQSKLVVFDSHGRVYPIYNVTTQRGEGKPGDFLSFPDAMMKFEGLTFLPIGHRFFPAADTEADTEAEAAPPSPQPRRQEL